MAVQEIHAFDELVATINRQWGTQVIAPYPAWPQPFLTTVSTGFSSLDTMLGLGGIPQRHLTTLMGSGTSGMTSLAYTLIAQAQQQEYIGVFIDPSQTFDPQSAGHRGVDFDLLLLVRPADWAASLSLLRDMVDIAVSGLVVFDAAWPPGLDKAALAGLELTLNRVTNLLPHSTWTLVLLLPGLLPFFPDHFSVLRLRCTCQEMIDSYPPGLQVEVQLLKDKFGPAGGRVSFAIRPGRSQA